MRFGITGMPKTGKTTVFNLITGSEVETGKFTASVEEIHRAICRIPDERLDKLSDFFTSKKKVPVSIDFLDFGGLSVGGDRESKLVGELRTMDAVVHVVRAFEDDEMPHKGGDINAIRDAENFMSELILNDLVVVENRLERIKLQLGKVKTDELIREQALLERIKGFLEDEKHLRDLDFTEDEEMDLKGFGFLSMKPILFALNISEDDAAELDTAVEKHGFKPLSEQRNIEVCPLCAGIEAEIALLEDDERSMFMDDLGITDLGANRLMQTAFRLLGLITFFTGSEKDAHAWAIPFGSNAVKAGGTIHSDIARGFIRAEVVSLDDLFDAGSIAEAKTRGAVHLEGKEYIVQDGDYIVVRFNV